MKPKLLLVNNFIVIILLLGFFGLFLAKKIDLTTADLGRHIKNGELIIHGTNTELHGVLFTNFYSYIMADQPFINHHWLAGVVFYLLYQTTGFIGLSVFYILLGCLTFFIFFSIARKASNIFIASTLALALMPLFASRAEVRPEMFSYLFSGVFLWVLSTELQKDTNLQKTTETRIKSLLWLLPLVMLLWVNLHIGFVFGFLILGVFIFEDLIKSLKTHGRAFLMFVNKNLWGILVLSIIAGLINPNFIKGFLYPLTIFKNYGYLIVENQSIKFLENLQFTQGQHFLLFKIAVIFTLISFVLAAMFNRRKISIALFLLTLVSGILAYNGIRHFPSFALFALVALANNIGSLIPNVAQAPGLLSGTRQAAGLRYKIAKSVFIPIGLFIITISLSQGYWSLKTRSDFGLGLLPNVQASAEFFKAQNINGPVFNDYDIGGYLIYNLDPLSLNPSPSRGEGDSNKYIFVDNRPEAYSAEFFEKVYKPMQADENKWKEMDEKYRFNAIFFSHRDYTPWAQSFLISRVKDENWAVVFVDGYNIIFLKRTEQNEEIIKKYEIPKTRFGIRS
jgi:hypothetical protein